ncbi:hypothetical protein ADL26_05115 [Thermoactinomyces vulgaris]|nr:hypothetical protein ADL26_05115 [Thermoactinomyces vulgaris]
MRGEVDVEDLAQDQDRVAAADGVRDDLDGAQHAVGGVALGLVGAGAVEAPDRGLLALVEDLGLGTQLGRRLGAVDPDVLGLDSHQVGALLAVTRSSRRLDRAVGCSATLPKSNFSFVEVM